MRREEREGHEMRGEAMTLGWHGLVYGLGNCLMTLPLRLTLYVLYEAIFYRSFMDTIN